MKEFMFRIDGLPERTVVGSYELPTSIFIPDDPFIWHYEQGSRAAVVNYSLYHEICTELRPRSIFEIGVRAGYSAYAMLAGANPGTLYRGLDMNCGTDGGIVNISEYAKEWLPRWFPMSDIKIVYGDSQQFYTMDRRFDLSHIDGDHSYAGALHDLELCARCSDWIVIDDITLHPTTVGAAVADFWQCYQDKYELEGAFYDTWRGHVVIKTVNMCRPLETNDGSF